MATFMYVRKFFQCVHFTMCPRHTPYSVVLNILVTHVLNLNLFITDTIGTTKIILSMEVSLIQRLINYSKVHVCYIQSIYPLYRGSTVNMNCSAHIGQSHHSVLVGDLNVSCKGGLGTDQGTYFPYGKMCRQYFLF